MFKSTFLSALALLFASTTFGQITWQPLNGPTGANGVKILAVDHSGRIFLHHGYDLFTSTDNGDSWSLSNDGIPADALLNLYQIISLPSGEIIAHPGYYYYKYDPATNNWSVDARFTEYSNLFLDSQQRIWGVGNWGDIISYSVDGGQTFQIVLADNQIEGWLDQMANYNDAHNLFAASGKLYHFNINGALTLISDISGNISYLKYNPFSGTAFIEKPGSSLRSIDGGLSWTEIILKTNPNEPNSANIVELFYESATVIWASTDKGMFLSENDGANWVSFQADPSIQPFYRKSDGTLFVNQECSEKDFMRSTDQGQTWADISEFFRYPDVWNVIVGKNEVLYALNCNQYDRSPDGGQSWSPATTSDSPASPMATLAIHPDGDLFSISSDRKIIRSTDGGYNWITVTQPDTTPWGDSYSTIQTDPFGNLYAFGSYSISYKSANKGQTWQTIKYGLSETNNSAPLFHPNGDIYRVDDYYTLHYLANQDSTVSEPTVLLPNGSYPDVYQSAMTAQGNVLFISGEFDFPNPQPELYYYRSNAVIELVDFPGDYPLYIATALNGLTFVVSHDSLYQSDNSGLQWTFIGKLPVSPTDYHPIRGIYVGNDQYLYLYYYHEVIYRSTQPITPPNQITGTAWYDQNNNCIKEPNEPPLINHYIKAESNTDYGGFSYLNGQYQVFAPDGMYQVSATPPNALFEACPPVSVTVGGQNDTAHADIALRPVAQCPYLRVNASTPLLRRCFSNTYTVHYANEGTATASMAYIEVTLDSLFDFLSTSVPPTSQNGQVLTFALGDLPPGASGQFWVQVEVSCLAALQQEHCFKAQIFPGVPCLPELVDRSITEECRANIGSFDPNDKRAFVDGQEEPGSISPDKTIEYLIRFQNTGTDTAFTVVVEDRIAGVLDLASVTPLVSSHPFRLELSAERTLRFIFDQILLPNSNIDEAASHGFIKFSVQQLPNLPSGTAIRNNAAIYFDFNAAVATNTSELVVTRQTGVYEPLPGYSVQAFPNPFHDWLHFRVTGPTPLAHGSLRLIDGTGRLVQEEKFTGSDWQLSRKNLPTGLYFFTVFGEDGQWIAAGRVIAD